MLYVDTVLSKKIDSVIETHKPKTQIQCVQATSTPVKRMLSVNE